MSVAEVELDEAYAEAEAAGVVILLPEPGGQPEKTAACRALYEEGLLAGVCTAILNAEIAAARAGRPMIRSTAEDLERIAATVERPKAGWVSRPCVVCGDEAVAHLTISARKAWCSGECAREWHRNQR